MIKIWGPILDVAVFTTGTTLTLSRPVYGAGGCGSVCLPLDTLDPEKTQLRKHT